MRALFLILPLGLFALLLNEILSFLGFILVFTQTGLATLIGLGGCGREGLFILFGSFPGKTFFFFNLFFKTRSLLFFFN